MTRQWQAPIGSVNQPERSAERRIVKRLEPQYFMRCARGSGRCGGFLLSRKDQERNNGMKKAVERGRTECGLIVVERHAPGGQSLRAHRPEADERTETEQ